jgi:hypothetical protein
MKLNKLDIITKFTLTLGISGMAVTGIGVGANLAGISAIGAFQFHKSGELESCVKKAFLFGNLLTGSGLFITGLASGIAKYAGENLPDSYFTEEGKGFTEDEEKYLTRTQKCNNCKYFHGIQYYSTDLVCAVNPSGVEESICPDWEQKPD